MLFKKFSSIKKQVKLPFKSLVPTSVYKFSELGKFSDSFLSGTNAQYIDSLYENWAKDRNSVHPSWDAYFTNEAKGLTGSQSFQLPPTLSNSSQALQPSIRGEESGLTSLRDQLRIQSIVYAYRHSGHAVAQLDPLELNVSQQTGNIRLDNISEKFDYKNYGFVEADLDKEFYISNILGGLGHQNDKMTLRALIDKLQQTYCGKVGFEFKHISDKEQRRWLVDKIESFNSFKYSKENKLKCFERLCRNDAFNNYCNIKFPTTKRFGVEGCDTLISGLGRLTDVGVQHGVDHMVFGMPHRGRLNTLAFVLWKPISEILAEFQEIKPEQVEEKEQEWGNAGDVKYHLGTTHDKIYPDGKSVRLQLLPNPSHLETVDPCVYGTTKAIQDSERDVEKSRAVGVIIHGDAAFAGQGVVFESMQFQDLNNYSVGGTIHVVVNNQVGFTTTPLEQRSGLYCTEIGKTIGSPIFHVNADEPELVDQIMELAFEFRQQFKKDVIVDVIGYRKHGHNELDEPMFTQPIMYNKIHKMTNIFEKYSAKLIQEGVLTEEQKQSMIKKNMDHFENEFQKSKNQQFDRAQWNVDPWEQIINSNLYGKLTDTGIPLETLNEIGNQLFDLSLAGSDFQPHPQIKKIYEQRMKNLSEQQGIDWSQAEFLAFGSLLKEGYGIRLSGQDVQRGTFSHRHAVVHNQKDGSTYEPFKRFLGQENAYRFTASNSHLSEYGVMGFEYGYSVANPNYLVMWEGQFGDFSNECQIMIDNYISSGESKWGTQTGLCILLPHGMDGQGPEHSSGRIERYLQLTDDDLRQLHQKTREQRLENQLKDINLQVLQCSTTANYFHALRRQLRRDFRKPMVAFNSKKLLKFRPASSDLAEFGVDRQFAPVLGETYPDEVEAPEQIQRVLICSGQVYYDLLQHRRDSNRKDIAILRIEQLAPFPYDQLMDELEKYTNAQFIFVQEEHQNQGAYPFARPRIREILSIINQNKKLRDANIYYAGRISYSATATGSHGIHKKQAAKLINQAFKQEY